MSNQGNVLVELTSGKSFIFTTGRWGGRGTPQIVQDAIDGLDNESSFLWALSHDERIYHPIHEIGNDDTPTVVVDFKTKTISWVDFAGTPGAVLRGEWSFEAYCDLDFVSVEGYGEWFR